jgi:two-component system sensor histidine kinase KdpD
MAEIALNAAAERETERLRTALVSSVSHELKSPLASLKASVTDVLDRVPEPDVSETRAILARANADLTRLDRSIGDLLDTSRLEARAWQPQTLEFEVGDAVGTAVHDLTDESRERLHYSIPRNLPLLLADFGQVCRAMRHLIDNALTYAEGTITVSAAAEGEGTVTIRVHDRGPGLSSTEKERVFDKFFRGTAGIASSSSTGLGLSLARDLIEANGGRIWTEEVLPHGAVFAFELPAGGTAEDLGGLHG